MANGVGDGTSVVLKMDWSYEIGQTINSKAIATYGKFKNNNETILQPGHFVTFHQ